jgi:protein-L-isoaspartate O-methyltransferase
MPCWSTPIRTKLSLLERANHFSQPYTVAFQTEKLEIKTGDKVLEIGTGSGYQACILMELGAKVYTIEYNQKLV